MVTLLGALNFLGRDGQHLWTMAAILAQVGATLMGVGYCCRALLLWRREWSARQSAAWACIALSGIAFAIGSLSALNRDPSEMLIVVSPADCWWVVQQPLLLAGVFLLAWRGERLSLVRLLADTLIVVLAALVLSWSVLTGRLLSAEQFSGFARIITLYYPMCDIALLFCALILLSNVRDRPVLSRAFWLVFIGVLYLICGGALSSYFFLSRQSGLWPWIDIIQGISYPLFGAGALVYARASAAEAALSAQKSAGADASFGARALELELAPEEGDMATDEAISNPISDGKITVWERTLGRWHRSAMWWLPTTATLVVSGVLVAREMREANPETIQRLLPVLALLLAIVARQMITLWDNLRLSEQLRARATNLKQHVDDRTRHLATLHRITSTLNNSLDKRTVLRVALEQTMTSVGAQGGGIWLRDAGLEAPLETHGDAHMPDVHASNAPAPDEWALVHWQGLPELPELPATLRKFAVAQAKLQAKTGFCAPPGSVPPGSVPPGSVPPGSVPPGSVPPGSVSARKMTGAGIVPPDYQLLQVPISSQGELLGVLALVRTNGQFDPIDRALVESVALEAGTALQNARLYSEAAERANRDSVTHLFNHRAVQEQLHATLARCKRSGGHFSLVMMDLNNFKFFNDTYGHPVGDDVLRNVASALRQASRASDVLGRYGGDEFIMLLPDTNAQGTLEACARIQTALDARYLEPVAGTRLPISMSFGWSSFPADGENVLDLLTAADQHLYDHKRGNASRGFSEAQEADQGELRRLKNRAIGGSFGVLDALVTAIDNKDHYTRHHSEEVTYLSMLVARELGYGESQLEAVRISGLLHDVGKIAVPDDVLRHPGKLSREQWEIMQQHPTFGALIVKDVPHLSAVSDGIRYHHEKWDGSGYPENLVGEAIPMMGRLLAMGDCYSALTTDRPYRKGWTPEAALEEIARCAGTHFDPNLCAIFLRLMERELRLDAGKADYSARIAKDFGRMAKEGQTKSAGPVVGRTDVPLAQAQINAKAKGHAL